MLHQCGLLTAWMFGFLFLSCFLHIEIQPTFPLMLTEGELNFHSWKQSVFKCTQPHSQVKEMTETERNQSIQPNFTNVIRVFIIHFADHLKCSKTGFMINKLLHDRSLYSLTCHCVRHAFSTTYPGPGSRGNRLSNVVQMSLSLAASSSVFLGDPKTFSGQMGYTVYTSVVGSNNVWDEAYFSL